MGSFLGGIAKTAVGIAPYLSRAVQETEDRGLNTSLKKAQVASLTNKGEIIGHQIAQDGTPYNIHRDGTWVKAPVEDGTAAPAAPSASSAPAPSAPAPDSPSFGGPSAQDWSQSLRRVNAPQEAQQQSMPPVAVTPQQGTPAQATQPPPGVRVLPKFGKPTATDPAAAAAAKATAVGEAKKPFLAAAAQQAITTDSTKAANRSAIANSPAAITADSTKKANAQNIRVVNPLPTRTAAAGKPSPYSQEAITADSIKAANRALSRPGGMTGGMGSGGLGGIMRTDGAVTELRQAHNMMLPFEKAVTTGKATYDGLDYFNGQLSKMYDAHGITDKALHAATFAHINQVNPELANYLGAAEAWALADGGVSGRTSDFRTKLDGFVSAIGPHANPQRIANVQQMRSTRLEAMERYQPAMRSIADKIAGGGRGKTPAPFIAGNPDRGDDPGGSVDLGSVDPFAKLIPKKP